MNWTQIVLSLVAAISATFTAYFASKSKASSQDAAVSAVQALQSEIRSKASSHDSATHADRAERAFGKKKKT